MSLLPAAGLADYAAMRKAAEYTYLARGPGWSPSNPVTVVKTGRRSPMGSIPARWRTPAGEEVLRECRKFWGRFPDFSGVSAKGAYLKFDLGVLRPGRDMINLLALADRLREMGYAVEVRTGGAAGQSRLDMLGQDGEPAEYAKLVLTREAP